IYTKKKTPPGNNIFDFSLRPLYLPGMSPDELNTEPLSDIDIEKETDKLLLSRYVPASVVVNKDLQIIRFHGATSNYLQPSSGRASLHLLKMVKDEFVFELKGLINRAKKEAMPVKKDAVHISQNGIDKEISIEVVPVKSPSNDFYFLILFKEMLSSGTQILETNNRRSSAKNSNEERITKLEQQLNEAREYMKTMSEEFEATREELQSANEEVLSSNEELQSINEELETSKEELQSTNEELVTINEELQQRNNDLKEISDFSQAIIETINEPLLVLRADMRVRNANRAFYKMFKTNIDKTEGHYLFEMQNAQFNIPELKKHLIDTAQKEKGPEVFEVTHSFHGIGEKILLFNTMRMEKEDNKKSRILLVIQDVTDRKKAERELGEERIRQLLQNAFDIMTIYSKEGNVLYQSEALERSLGYPAVETLGKNIFEMGIVHPDDLPVKKKLFQDALKWPGENIKGHIRLQHKNGFYKPMDVIFRNLLSNDSIKGIIANYQYVSKTL
ncbi:MAG TPA: PAS domain S-box protein, partial [Chitinophagaceae bacterium]|nr:PAS domain S-box protein [Chitinophagaceae bacterium]